MWRKATNIRPQERRSGCLALPPLDFRNPLRPRRCSAPTTRPPSQPSDRARVPHVAAHRRPFSSGTGGRSRPGFRRAPGPITGRAGGHAQPRLLLRRPVVRPNGAQGRARTQAYPSRSPPNLVFFFCSFSIHRVVDLFHGVSLVRCLFCCWITEICPCPSAGEFAGCILLYCLIASL